MNTRIRRSKVILIGEDLLTTLAAGSTVLLLLAELRTCKKAVSN